MEFEQRSDELHARVQAFAAGDSRETFEQLALDIARHQAATSPGFQRLVSARGGRLETLADVPPVPSDAFKLARVATFPSERERVRFYTSGTTGSDRGAHAMRRTDTYERVSLKFGRSALLSRGAARPVVVALAPTPSDPPGSSLGYMMAHFMRELDGRDLPRRWLLDDRGVDVSALERASTISTVQSAPLLVLATAFALVRLLDDLEGAHLPLPPGSVVMQTGGFKGRSREVSMEALREAVATAFQIPSERVVGEYGMTELTSQLYEATLRDSDLGSRYPDATPGTYYAPPWLRVAPVDPLSLRPVDQGDAGLACFVDLGNVDSAVCVVTQDLIRVRHGGVELLGRQPGAPARGCSLAIEALLG